MHPANPWANVRRDLFIFTLCLGATFFIAQTRVFSDLLELAARVPKLGVFVSGFFFTSVFTIAPAGLILAKLSLLTGPLFAAAIGAAGSVISDTIIFLFFQRKLKRDIDTAIHSIPHHNPLKVFHFEFLKWLNPILGALVIISPLPDEIGLVLLGFSSISMRKLIFTLYILNFIGIFFLAEIAALIQ
jgi:hypothetical protein